MHVTTQSSFLIILRVCWRPTRSSRRSCRTTSSLPWSSARRYKLNLPHTSWWSSLVFLDKTISSRALPPSESRQREQWSLWQWYDRLSTLLFYEHAFNYTCHAKCHFNFSGLKCQHVITCLQFEMTYINLTRLSFWLKRSFVAFIISLLQTGLIECHKLLTILYKM